MNFVNNGPTNVAASVRGRLFNLSKQNGEEFGQLLSRFAIERLLYRLSVSPHRDRFLLKGAALLALWPQVPRRPTRDVDFLGTGESSPETLAEVFREVCAVDAPEDGLVFEASSVSVVPIREEQRYGGQRVRLGSRLEAARIALQIDVGFGDAVTPAPTEADYPTLLPLPAPRLKLYPLETVVAEKWQAMVELGSANGWMKDFYDVWILSRHVEFDGSLLSRAVNATFTRRQTPLPMAWPTALGEEFCRDPAKITQWRAFLRKNKLQADELCEIVSALEMFLWPVTEVAREGQPLNSHWTTKWKADGRQTAKTRS